MSAEDVTGSGYIELLTGIYDYLAICIAPIKLKHIIL